MARLFEGDQGRAKEMPYYDTVGFGGQRYMAFRRRQRMNLAVTVLHCLLGAYVLMWVVLIWFL